MLSHPSEEDEKSSGELDIGVPPSLLRCMLSHSTRPLFSLLLSASSFLVADVTRVRFLVLSDPLSSSSSQANAFPWLRRVLRPRGSIFSTRQNDVLFYYFISLNKLSHCIYAPKMLRRGVVSFLTLMNKQNKINPSIKPLPPKQLV